MYYNSTAKLCGVVTFYFLKALDNYQTIRTTQYKRCFALHKPSDICYRTVIQNSVQNVLRQNQ